jgi:CDP-diacylglycerol--glycerol-3-phosphate 3-phosphatidyltransferase
VDLDTYLDRWSAAHGGYDPRGSVWPRAWLRLTYAAGVPLARRGVSPGALTAAGVLACGLVPVLAARGWPVAAAGVVAASGLLDSLDGAVAVLRDRVTPFGYVLDSVADRVGEALYLLALWSLGAPGWWCVLGGGLAWLLEYSRARAVGAGLTAVGVVTVWERATRVAVTAAGLLLAGAFGAFGAFGAAGAFGAFAAVTAAAWVVLGLVGVTQLLVVVRRRLGR